MSAPTTSYEKRWLAHYDKLVKFKAEHKHTQVSASFGLKELDYWVKRQRKLKHKGKLSKERVDLLDQLDFDWTADRHRTPHGSVERWDKLWFKNYRLLVQFKNKYGHSVVTKRYQMTELYNWVRHQRRRKKHNKLTKARVDLLDVLGFRWEPDVQEDCQEEDKEEEEEEAPDNEVNTSAAKPGSNEPASPQPKPEDDKPNREYPPLVVQPQRTTRGCRRNQLETDEVQELPWSHSVHIFQTRHYGRPLHGSPTHSYVFRNNHYSNEELFVKVSSKLTEGLQDLARYVSHYGPSMVVKKGKGSHNTRVKATVQEFVRDDMNLMEDTNQRFLVSLRDIPDSYIYHRCLPYGLQIRSKSFSDNHETTRERAMALVCLGMEECETHWDGYDSILYVLSGTKTFWIAKEKIRVVDDKDSAQTRHDIDPSKGRYGGYSWRKVELKANDAVYVPARCYHKVLSNNAVALSLLVETNYEAVAV